MATSNNEEQEIKRWQERANELGVSRLFLLGVNLSDDNEVKALHKTFGVEDDYFQRAELNGFVEWYKQNKKRESLEPSPRPFKKLKCDGAANPVSIEADKAVELRTRKIADLNDKMREKVDYFGREGTQELFNVLVMSRKELAHAYNGRYNISLIGHHGAGKSTMAWAVAHHVANGKESVLWLSRRSPKQEWTVHLFEWDEQRNMASIYKIDDPPDSVKEILENDVCKSVTLVILDTPTKSKTDNEEAGVKAFEWTRRGENRRVIHVSSLGAFSLDDRILGPFFVTNLRMNPWNRSSFVASLKCSANLKKQVIDTLLLEYDADDPKLSKTQRQERKVKRDEKEASLLNLTPEELVDSKFFFSGINARWFFNESIEKIKTACANSVKRMGEPSNITGEAAAGAVNSVSVDIELSAGRTHKLYTSAYMVCALSDKSVTNQFLKLFPLVADRLGNGTPGEVFEFDFAANLEHSHNQLIAQQHLMGDKCEAIHVELGTDIVTKKRVFWRAGKLLELPKGKSHSTTAQPISDDADPGKPNHYWFVPVDPSQPFLDFFLLEPTSDGKYRLRVIQNTVSPKHTTNLDGLKSVVTGVLNKGFKLEGGIDVVFIVEDPVKQKNVGSGMQKSLKATTICGDGRGTRSTTRSTGATTELSFQLKVSRVHYISRGIAP